MQPRQWVQVRANNYVVHSHVLVSLEEGQGPGKWPKFVNQLEFQKGSKTLAALPELRKKDVTLRPNLNFQFERPPVLRARQIRLRASGV